MLLPLDPLKPLPLIPTHQPRRKKVTFHLHVLINPFIEKKEEVKEEAADVDMGGLFGEEY